MIIGIVGLGLIGGSMAKALKKRTDHTVYACDAQKSVVYGAKLLEAIDGELTNEKISTCDFLILCLYPEDAIAFARDHARYISKDCIVLDTCGVKQVVCESMEPIANECGFTFVGAHPMAGIAASGFENARDTMFVKASMILTPYPGTSLMILDRIRTLCVQMGFTRTPVLTPKKHDVMIAYTSQLAHVVSSAYIRTPLALEHRGYSAGSFRDMTRVAKLNASMWTELFLDNSENLANEIDALIKRLQAYSTSIRTQDAASLQALLEEGTQYKLHSEER